ncbi:hypothetical protein [Scytonema sp. NUACC26]|uniref:hypothetical protein n=1 Tax=Scytonema sp. NUACC26 TaxID=3140176 RepID=UPI0034DBF34B
MCRLNPPLSRAENFHQTSSRAPIEVDSSAQTSKSCGDDVPPHQVYTPTQSSLDKDLRSTQLNTQVYTPYTNFEPTGVKELPYDCVFEGKQTSFKDEIYG